TDLANVLYLAVWYVPGAGPFIRSVDRRSAHMRRIAGAFGDQPPGCSFDRILKSRKKHVPIEAWRDWVKNLHPHRAGEPQKAARRPEQARMECNRYAGHTAIGVEMGDAELVLWVGAGRPARTFGEDDDLTAFGERLAGMRRHVGQRSLAGAAVDRDHAAMP